MSEDILDSVSRYFSPAIHLIQGCHYEGAFFPSSIRGHSWSSCSPDLFLLAENSLGWCEFGWVDKHAWLSPFPFFGSGNPKGWSTLSHGEVGVYCLWLWRRQWQPTPVFLPGKSHGWGSLVGCRLWGCTESDTTEVTWQQQQQNLYWATDFF